jgi:nucleotide-binding universal stress UspA family protein
MYEAILVALADGESDRAALTAGIRLAKASAARLHIVHVRRQTGSPAGQDAEKGALLAAVSFAADELGESVSFELIEPPGARRRARTVAAHLASYAEDHHIDMIVMGTHARSRVERSILGSVGDGLIRATHLPILLIPRKKGPAQIRLRLRNILIPLDGTPAAEQILPDAVTLATLLKGSVSLVRVIPPEPLQKSYLTGDYPKPLAREEFMLRSARSEEYLDRIAEPIRSNGITVDALTLVGDPVSPVIKIAAAIEEVDVIAIATRGIPPYALFRQSGIGDDLIDGARRAVLIKRQESVTADLPEASLQAHEIGHSQGE